MNALDTQKGGADDNSAQAGHLVAENEALTRKCLTTGTRIDMETETFVAAPTLTASNDPSRSPQSAEITAQVEAINRANQSVRRLTPTECERLQGFPDRWTLLPAQADDPAANPKPDSHRYSMMGNAVTVNVAEWIGRQIVSYEIERKAA